MGNSESKECLKHTHRKDDPLRDYGAELSIPSNISKPKSNLLLAYSDGHYFPCIILGKSRKISNGYTVLFLHSQVETEIPSSNVIGNFEALLDCKISFIVDGQHYCGYVHNVCTNERTETANFFVSCGEQCGWISLPSVFLTVAQARQLC